ncbi:hypothetical protein EHS25_004459 [Saitozyma podzolica]|uniref:Arrestin-like N-terminal domain-containing protein n=1 Tax=Saitozyma podzolica TaxID=1890683 RepID=A0A427YU35_9TREE|nr:hypothetical protein EHS25_004459 [Saitozyma podzolica]
MSVHRPLPPLPPRTLLHAPSPLLANPNLYLKANSPDRAGLVDTNPPARIPPRPCPGTGVHALPAPGGLVRRLNLGPMRGWEDDVLFERKVEIRGRIVLEEGKQRFDFTIVVPTNLGPHDWHPNARITHTLTAEVVGQSKSSSSWFSSLSLSSPKHSGHNGTGQAGGGGIGSGAGAAGAGAGVMATPGPDAGAGPSTTSPSPTGRAVSPHPQPPPPPDSSRTGRSRSRGRATDKSSGRSKSKSRGGVEQERVDPPDAMGIARQMLVSWEDPSASSSKEGEDGAVPWLVGTYETHRPIRLVYNPDVAGGVSSLDMDIPIRAAGLGRVHLRWTSKVWTVCAPLQTSLRISADPGATIYSLRVSLTQTTTIHSPRDVSTPTYPVDVEGIKTVRQYEIWKQGVRPRKGEVLGEDTPALWRNSRFEGKGGAGDDEGEGERERESGENGEEYVVRGVGRLPDDKTMRPSTLAGILTPIEVSHSLLLEIWFSIDQPKSSDGPTNAAPPELSVMRTEKSVIVPSCALIPSVLSLPTYEDTPGTDPSNPPPTCPLCHLPPTSQFCQTCPPTSLLHARHDLDPDLVGDPSGVCKLCAERISGAAEEVWKGCACGMRLEDMEEWMEGAVGEGEGEQGRADWKYEVERGRTA